MSKNKFKIEIQKRYKGRGNTWVKVVKNTEAYEIFNKKLSSIEGAEEFKKHIEREGYGWLRFSKVTGTEDEPYENFELRYKGSKLDHIDCIVTMPYNISKEMPLLGNTPVKLQIEIDPEKRKEKPVSFIRKNAKIEEEEIIEIDASNEIKIIKEAALTKASTQELEEWYEFLKLNGLYEDNVWFNYFDIFCYCF